VASMKGHGERAAVIADGGDGAGRDGHQLLPWQWLGRDRRTSRRITRSSAVRITLSSTIILRSVVVRSSLKAGAPYGAATSRSRVAPPRHAPVWRPASGRHRPPRCRLLHHRQRTFLALGAGACRWLVPHQQTQHQGLDHADEQHRDQRRQIHPPKTGSRRRSGRRTGLVTSSRRAVTGVRAHQPGNQLRGARAMMARMSIWATVATRKLIMGCISFARWVPHPFLYPLQW
jgi:hypothetical protein